MTTRTTRTTAKTAKMARRKTPQSSSTPTFSLDFTATCSGFATFSGRYCHALTRAQRSHAHTRTPIAHVGTVCGAARAARHQLTPTFLVPRCSRGYLRYADFFGGDEEGSGSEEEDEFGDVSGDDDEVGGTLSGDEQLDAEDSRASPVKSTVCAFLDLLPPRPP